MRKKIWKIVLPVAVVFALTACAGPRQEDTSDKTEDAAGALTAKQQALRGAAGREEAEEPQTDAAQPSEDVPQSAGESEELTEEELMEYLAQFLPVASHKPEYAQPVVDALEALPEEKPESALKQKDVDCDTLQWFNATYAMFLESSGMDYHLIGGNDDRSSSNVDYIRNQLDRSWGITDRASTVDTLYWLIQSGHAEGFAEEIQMMGLYGFLELSKEELRQTVLEMADGENLTEENALSVADYFWQEIAIYETCGENGIDAWDYCRFMQIAGSCYYAGYLTLEESLDVQLEAARAIQMQFGSWEEMNQSYLQGYIFWVDNSTAAYIRERAYERLQEAKDSPFRLLDFDMPLEKFW